MSEQLTIFDTTLRDGEQSPGASMTRDEKVRIAKVLERMRVDVIVCPFTGSGIAGCINGQTTATTAGFEIHRDRVYSWTAFYYQRMTASYMRICMKMAGKLRSDEIVDRRVSAVSSSAPFLNLLALSLLLRRPGA